ncbi:MAG: M28 family metallopeptidase [Promethearchaeota archaeon]
MDIDEVGREYGAEGNELVREVCEVAWERLPGSDGEARGQEFLARKLEEFGADEVTIREFKVRQRFFRWWPVVSVVLFYGSLAGYLFFPALAVLLCALMVANLYFKLFSYTFLDVLFRNKPSSNVVAKLKARELDGDGRPRALVILGGHTDANYEYPIGRKWGPAGLVKVVLPTLLLMLYWTLASVARLVVSLVLGWPPFLPPEFAVDCFLRPDWLFLAGLAATPFVSWVGFRMVSGRAVAGANDNLSGVAVAAEVLKFFVDHPGERPAGVELWAVCFGSEEGGMMGSKTMAADVRRAIDDGTFPVPEERLWVVNFDTVGSDGPVHISTREPMYRVKAYMPRVYEALAAAAEKTNVEFKLKSLSVGGTDSAPFGRLGIPASSVLCLDGSRPINWHTREDTPENVDPAGIVNCVKLSIQFLKDLGERR